jgi:hypothetical protein
MEKYPASWMILSHFMWTMWFVGVWTSGMYDPLSFQLRRRIFGWLLEWLASALDAEDELPRKPPERRKNKPPRIPKPTPAQRKHAGQKQKEWRRRLDAAPMTPHPTSVTGNGNREVSVLQKLLTLVPHFCHPGTTGHMLQAYTSLMPKPAAWSFSCGSSELNPAMGVNVMSLHVQAVMSDIADVFPILIDSGASICITHMASDFVTPIVAPSQPQIIGGLAHGLPIEGRGYVDWTFLMDEGTFRVFRILVCYVPKANRRLLSPQAVDQQGRDPVRFLIDGKIGILQCKRGTGQVTSSLDPRTNLPFYSCINGSELSRRQIELNSCITEESNQNLSESQKELIKWHFRLGHLNFTAVQHLLRAGHLGKTRLQSSAANCAHPKCASCQYGKARQRATPSEIKKLVKEKEGALKKGDIFPGQKVSIDHFKCSAKGRLYESKGKTPDDLMYTGGCIFVDHCSGYIHVEHQVLLTAGETIAAKHRYERLMLQMGVTVTSYQSDNGTFGSAAYTKEIMDRYQDISYSGVGAHHHNGVAERAIGTIMSMARTMMLHAAVRWPDVADSTNWPMAVDYAVYIYNHVPNALSGLSPIELATRVAQHQTDFSNLHVWGSPSYVLDPKLQDGRKSPSGSPGCAALFLLAYHGSMPHQSLW